MTTTPRVSQLHDLFCFLWGEGLVSVFLLGVGCGGLASLLNLLTSQQTEAPVHTYVEHAGANHPPNQTKHTPLPSGSLFAPLSHARALSYLSFVTDSNLLFSR